MSEEFSCIFILLSSKYNLFNSLKLTFSNILISDISLNLKSNSFNSLKFTFSNILISDISL